MDEKIPNLSHLWKKGQSGNPKGRPKGRVMTATLKELVENKVDLMLHPITGEKNVRLTMREIIILQLIKKSIKGDMEAIKTVLERIDGKVPLPMDHSGVTIQLATVLEYIKDPSKLIENMVNVEEVEKDGS